MRSVRSTSCSISPFSPHEYIASANNVSWRDIVSIETPSCLSEIFAKAFQISLGCTTGALPFLFQSALEGLSSILVCNWLSIKGLVAMSSFWKLTSFCTISSKFFLKTSCKFPLKRFSRKSLLKSKVMFFSYKISFSILL